MTCEMCGNELRLGAWPWCPHRRYGGTVIGDDIPGGFVQENFGHQPETFYSKKAMARRAKELGLINVAKWAGPSDKNLTRWAKMDPQTLRNAEELVARVGTARATAEPEVTLETYRPV